jgi:hypothetical protein
VGTRARRRAFCAFFLFLGMTLIGTGQTSGGTLWVYELGDCLMFYQVKYPGGNWIPYIEKLDLIKEGLDRGEPTVVRHAMDGFLTMLRARAHGIADVAAHDLYQRSLDVLVFQKTFSVGLDRQSGTDPIPGLRELRTTPRESRDRQP